MLVYIHRARMVKYPSNQVFMGPTSNHTIQRGSVFPILFPVFANFAEYQYLPFYLGLG